MFRSGKRALAAILIAGLALTACSSQGGKQEEGGGAVSGRADTPRMKIAIITHAAPGDTFWDIVRKGAQAAAAKDNVKLIESSDPDGAGQANLVQNAIDSKVDGIAVTLSKPDALAAAVKRAQAAGIPVVAFNSGFDNWQEMGVPMYFGQDETLAGEAAGKRLAKEGAKRAICVIMEQGAVQLEARCAGLKKGLTSGQTEILNVQGTDMPSVRSTIAAKLRQDPSITHVVTLGAPFALTAVKSLKDAGSDAKLVTFDMNPDLVKAIQAGDVQWAIDQQPYLQGYLAIDSLWLNQNNGNTIGGGQAVLTGPSFVTKENVDEVAEFAAKGTR